MVDGRMMYDLSTPAASALTISRSTLRCRAVPGSCSNESSAGVLAVAGVGFRSV